MSSAVVVHDSFLAAAYALPKEVTKKILKALHFFSRDARHPGLNLEKLQGDLWSLRVDDQYRLILVFNEQRPQLLYVSTHDDSYRFADRWARQHPKIGSEGIAYSFTDLPLPSRSESSASARSALTDAVVVKTRELSGTANWSDLQGLLKTRKYVPLARLLMTASGDAVKYSFTELEKHIGVSLPPSARAYRAWWANERTMRHSHATAWLGVGWNVSAVDLAHGTVEFQRQSSVRWP